MKYNNRIAACVLLAASVVPSWGARRVACIGNSITYGFLVENREQNAYPKQLGRMLGEEFEVGNFGHSGSTLLMKGHNPYMKLPEYAAALEFKPDVAVIHLGVNDTDPRDWPEYGDEFVKDYVELINSLKRVNPKVEVFVARLTPLSAKHFRFRSGTRDWRLEVNRAIENVAKITGAKLIDFNEPFRDRQNLMPDGIHPNAEGAGLLAETVYKAITNKYGPLRLPAYYTSGMVLQRNRALHIDGKADANAEITLTLAGQRYRTRANSRGEWQVVTAPLVTGPKYTMTVTDGKDTLTFNDILAGEVWMASGQSNMEFTLAASVGGKEAIANCGDNELRIYHMKDVARTDNVEWSDSIKKVINRNGYFHPATWQPIDSLNSKRFSAVAYHFGRVLRDSLKVPVGIIFNAVGGSPCESWIDVNTLEQGMPEILVNWRKNDYVQKWCQGRADKNTSNVASDRHPYEPSYLFGAGIRPLGQPDIAGTIWYQGESNAHNTMLWEQLFPMLVKSWRQHFRNEEMPFYMVQLSSINRPSWPTFRDAQRRTADKLDNVWMAVSADHGNPTDVHPRNKRPVGERLARQALHNTYGYTNVVSAGPEFVGAEAHNGVVTLKVRNGAGMKGANEAQVKGFELAEVDGYYYPAEAVIVNDSIIELRNISLMKPRFVRYAWQPYTELRLVNGEDLPASTMKMEMDNAADYDMESGIECGVSAPFAGKMNGRLVMAGGCNFPVDPLGAKSQKKFYKGIYAADPAVMEWKRVGTLPEAMAYGLSVPVADNKVLLIGGTTAEGSTGKVWMATADQNGAVSVEELACSLPVSIDNAAATVLGNKVYVVGGSQNGKPSKDLWMLELADNGTVGAKAEWKKLRSMPGNARVQPVMVAAKDAEGNDALYVWGGFAGAYDGKQPTVETGGLRYSVAKNKWTVVKSPVDAQGETLTLGGGVAVKLADGRIAACGGVNKDIFVNALRALPEGYLTHPIEWYKFNPNVVVFDPKSETWSVAEQSADVARAGAAIVAGGANDFYLMGGEVKPRIRTAQTLHVEL